jgi:hypothetical protein
VRGRLSRRVIWSAVMVHRVTRTSTLARTSVVSIEFVYPKNQAELFDKLIPMMTRELGFNAAAPGNPAR